MAENEQKETEKDEQAQDEQKKVEKTEEEKREDRRAWMRFILIIAAVLIPLVTGLVCLIGGTNHNNQTVAFAGKIILEAVVPGVMAILIAVVLTRKYRSVKKAKENATSAAGNTTPATDDTTTATDEASDETSKGTPSQKEREQQTIGAVNSTHGYASRAKLATYEMDNIVEGMQHAPKWGLPVGLTCFFSLFALLIVATVLLIKRIFVGAIVCAAIVGVILIATFIIMAVSRAKATNGDIRKAKKITEGKVKACFMVGTAEMRTPHGHGETVRIQSVTYRVIVVADGVEYGAFSKQFYETDQTVTVAVMGKNRAKIVESAAPEKTETESNDTE